MLVSVITPVSNTAQYLAECIGSILSPRMTDFELLLIDDGSTDGESGASCDRYAAAHPERSRAIHKPNGGVGEARNVGIEAAQGEYLLMLNNDVEVRDGDWPTDLLRQCAHPGGADNRDALL